LLSSTEFSGSKDRKFENPISSSSSSKPLTPTINNYTTPTSQINFTAAITNPVSAVNTPKVTTAPMNSARKPAEEKYNKPTRPSNIQSNYERDYEMFKNAYSQKQTPIMSIQGTPQNQQNQRFSVTYEPTPTNKNAPKQPIIKQQETVSTTTTPKAKEEIIKNRLKDVLENRPLQMTSTSNNKASGSNKSQQQTLQKSSSMRQYEKYERSVREEENEKTSQSGYSSKTDQIARHMRSTTGTGAGGRSSKESSIDQYSYGSIQQPQVSRNEEISTMRPQKEGLLSVRAMLEDLSNRKNSIKYPMSEMVSPTAQQMSTKNVSMREMFSKPSSEYRKNDLIQESRLKPKEEDAWEQKKDPLEEIDYLSSICSIDDEPAEATMISDQIVDTVRILQGKKQEQMLLKHKQAEIASYSSNNTNGRVIRKTQEIRAEENPKCEQETKRRTRDHRSGGSIKDFEYINSRNMLEENNDFIRREAAKNNKNLEIMTFDKADFNILATNRNKCDTSRSKRSSANHERNLEYMYQMQAQAQSQVGSQKTSPMVRRNPVGFSRSSNKQLVKNALNNVCLAGEVNRREREEVLARMDEVKDRNNFIIVFKETSGRQDFKALYYFDSAANIATKIYSNGSSPSVLDESLIANYYRYDSGSREFKNIADNKTLSIIVDAVGLNSFVTRRF